MHLMSIIDIFPTEQSCITEKIRWGERPICPHCGSDCVARKKVYDKIDRWNCHYKYCKSTFTVKTGTLFNGTQIALRKWFLAISIMMNAKKSVSSYQLGRELGVQQPTALAIYHRIRKEMGRKTSKLLLHGIIVADETFKVGNPVAAKVMTAMCHHPVHADAMRRKPKCLEQ